LRALTEAARLGTVLDISEERRLELRNEAIACLALPDLWPGKLWGGYPPGSNGLAFDTTLQRYARSDERGNVSVRRVADDQELAHLNGQGEPATSLRFSPDGQCLATRSWLGPWRVWNVVRDKIVLEAPPGFLDFSPDSRRMAVAITADHSVALYDLASSEVVKRLAPRAAPPRALAFHPDGRQLAIASLEADHAVEIYDIEADRSLVNWPLPAGVRAVAWRPDRGMLAAACGDFRLYVWDMETQRRVAVLEGHEGEPTEVAFNCGGNLLASRGWDGNVYLWDAVVWKLLCGDTPDSGTTHFRCQFSPDDRQLAFSWDSGSRIGLWEVADGRECRMLRNYKAPYKGPHSVEFSPDHRWLASTHDDGVRFWGPTSRWEILHLDEAGTRP
jgi:WD40 repeat protein